jgi:hypothetical protein
MVGGNESEFELFNTCLMYFHWHNTTIGILGSTDTLMATGISILTNVTDLSEPV